MGVWYIAVSTGYADCVNSPRQVPSLKNDRQARGSALVFALIVAQCVSSFQDDENS